VLNERERREGRKLQPEREVTMSGRLRSESRWAEIDLGVIRHNVRTVIDALPPAARLLAVIKANGYGHGAIPVGRAMLEAGADMLAVSTPQEAVELRDVCPPDRILALGGLTPVQAGAAVAAGCAVTCHSRELADALDTAARPGMRVPVHLKVDSGMGRLGCAPAEAAALARHIAGAPRLRLAGVFTHFASAECDEAFTREQFERFQGVLDGLEVDPGLRHACNSAAALRYPDMALDAVRCGLALYGYDWPGVRPALALRALVTQVKEVQPGGTVGYGRIWRAERMARIATVAIGYEDGVFRRRSNRGTVAVCGHKVSLVGRVSMDQVTVDVTVAPDVRAGDVATIIGDGISATEVGEWSDTVSYEILTSLGTRVRRVYLDS
jgi:alanine racemase